MKKILTENKGRLFFSSLIILLPFLCSLLMGKEPFYRSFLLLAIHWLCLSVTCRDRKNGNQSRKALHMIFWLVPVLAMVQGAVFFLAHDDTIDYSARIVVMCFGIGLVFLMAGNYLPKIRRNRTLGIKVRWALENEENWNATHRFAGKVWVIAGFTCMACGLIPQKFSMALFPAAILLAAFLPCIYSRQYYGKQINEGRAERIRSNPKAIIFSGIVMAAVAVFVLWVLFTGSLNIVYGEQSFTAETPNWKNLTVRYEDIRCLVYEPEGLSEGGKNIRTGGFGNLRLSLGAFSNDKYGPYTRYTFASCDSYVEMTVNGKIIVINGPDEDATESIYNTLRDKIKLSENE